MLNPNLWPVLFNSGSISWRLTTIFLALALVTNPSSESRSITAEGDIESGHREGGTAVRNVNPKKGSTAKTTSGLWKFIPILKFWGVVLTPQRTAEDRYKVGFFGLWNLKWLHSVWSWCVTQWVRSLYLWLEGCRFKSVGLQTDVTIEPVSL